MSWRRILLLSAVFLVALVAATTWVLQRLAAPTAFVRRQLAAVLAAPFELGEVTLDVAGGAVLLRDFDLHAPDRPGTSLLRLAAVRLELDLAAAGAGVVPHRVTLDGCELELGPRLPRLAALLHAEAPGTTAPAGPLPAVELHRGRLRYRHAEGREPFLLDDVELQLLPDREGSRAVLTGRATAPALGSVVQLNGELRGDGAYQLQITIAALGLETARLRTVADQFGVDLGDLQLTGTASDLQVTLTGGGGEPPAARAAVQLQRLAARTQRLPPLIEAADVALAFGTARGGELQVRIRQQSDRGELEVRVQISDLANTPTCDLEARGRQLRVDPDTIAAMRLFPLGDRLMAALGPHSGRADIDLFLRDPHTPPGAPNSFAEFDLTLHDVAMAYHGFGEGDDQVGFPLPVIHGEGHVRMRGDLVRLENLRAEVRPEAGGGTVRLDGVVAPKLPAGEDTSLDIRANGIAFGPPLRAALDGLLHDDGRLYDRLAPSGRADVELQVRPRQQLAGGWTATLRPVGARMCWGGFPYALEDLGGAVTMHPGEVGFDLAGRHGTGRLTLRGTIPLDLHSEEKVTSFAAVVELQDVAVDDALRAAVQVAAADLDEPWQASRARGRLSGTARVWRGAPDQPLHHDLRLQLSDGAFDLPCAPWRTEQVTGALLVACDGPRTRIVCDALRGRLGHGDTAAHWAPFSVSGLLERGGAAACELVFTVDGLALDNQLGTTLEAEAILPAGLWQHLRPSGSVDFVCRHRRDTAGGMHTALDLQLADAASAAPMLPHPLTQLQGRVQVADGLVWFDEVRGLLGGNRIHCERGRIAKGTAADPRTTVTCTVRAPDVPIDAELGRLFPGPLGTAIAARRPTGRAAIDALNLVLRLPTGDSAGRDWPLTTEVAGALRLRDVGVVLGTGPDAIAVREANALVQIEPSVITDAGGALRLQITNGALRLFGQPLVAMSGTAVADAEQITLETLSAKLHNGSLQAGTPGAPALRYLLPSPTHPEGRLSGDLRCQDVDVLALLRECGWQKPPYKGLATGRVTLSRLDGSDLVGAAASGQLVVDRADLGEVPLFTAIYAQLPAPQRPRFDRLATAFSLKDGRLECRDLQLRSNLLAATGSGWLDLDGHLDIRLQLDNLLGPSADPLLMPLVDLLTSGIVRFHLYGHLRQIQTERRWLTEQAPRRQPVPPMPPYQRPPTHLDS
jgi:hypothetical protein